MLRLNVPSHTFQTALEHCRRGISGNPALARTLTESADDLMLHEQAYIQNGRAGELFKILPISTTHDPDPVVVKFLRKSDLVKIYDQYFAAAGKPARAIYDEILNSAVGQCPFCGGIGTPRNLDHFLPKVHFPQYAVLPRNLVPACRDCNMDGKGHAFAKLPSEQIIQPYIDNDCFFVEQWIFARYHKGSWGEPGEFEYFVQPPKKWAEIDKAKAARHFQQFELARKYGTKAAELLGVVLKQIAAMKEKELDSDAIKGILLLPGVDSAPFPNHWQKSMFQALIHYGW